MKKLKKQKGITILSLIITVIIMLILAGIGISTLFGDGLFSQVSEQSEIYKKEQAREKLQLALNSWNIEKFLNTNNTLFNFLSDKKADGSFEEVTQNGDIITVTIDGFSFDIDKDENIIKEEVVSNFDKEEWDKDATAEEAFLWASDVEGEEGYNTIIGYTAELSNYTIAKFPSRTEKIMISTRGDDAVGREFLGGIVKLEFPETLIEIGNNSFGRGTKFPGSSSLTTIEFPNSLKTIGQQAFYSCGELTNLVIPKNVEYIGYAAFYNATNLETITFEGDTDYIGGESFSETKWFEAQLEGLVYLNSTLYAYKGTLPDNTIVRVKEGTTNITSNIFSEQLGLIGIEIPNSVTNIGSGAFYGCRNLNNVVLPNKLEIIESYLFGECESLVNLTIPSSVIDVKDEAFAATPWHDNLPEGIVYINNVLFEYKGEVPENTVLTIKEGTTTISEGALQYQHGLIEVNMPDSVTYIGDVAFQECTNLTNVKLSENLDTIGYGVFSYTRIGEIVIPLATKTIELDAFYGCIELIEINCRANSKPAGWDESWNFKEWDENGSVNHTVNWGYTGS